MELCFITCRSRAFCRGGRHIQGGHDGLYDTLINPFGRHADCLYRFGDLSKFGEALAREGAVAIAPDFDETLAGSYTPDKDGGSSRDKIVVAA